nr:MAG TPA: hypothetical protein [Caudoviricetes sp.]
MCVHVCFDLVYSLRICWLNVAVGVKCPVC